MNITQQARATQHIVKTVRDLTCTCSRSGFDVHWLHLALQNLMSQHCNVNMIERFIINSIQEVDRDGGCSVREASFSTDVLPGDADPAGTGVVLSTDGQGNGTILCVGRPTVVRVKVQVQLAPAAPFVQLIIEV